MIKSPLWSNGISPPVARWKRRARFGRLVRGDDVLLRQGIATYHDTSHAISVGPGSEAHRLLSLTNGPAPAGCFRLAITLLTPLDARLTIRVGRWSEATRGICFSSDVVKEVLQ